VHREAVLNPPDTLLERDLLHPAGPAAAAAAPCADAVPMLVAPIARESVEIAVKYGDYVKRQERGALKEIADEHMGKLAGFADQLSAMVVEGCKADMEALAGRAEFEGRGWNGEEEVQRAVQRVVEMEV